MTCLRNDIEQCIKDLQIDRARFFEVGKHSYQQIISKIEDVFVDKSKCHNTTIHWANVGNYNPKLKCTNKAVNDFVLWLNEIPSVIPNSNASIYVLIEDTEKYWLYETYINELTTVLYNISICEVYIVSKKFDWLISLNHSDVASYIGEELLINGEFK